MPVSADPPALSSTLNSLPPADTCPPAAVVAPSPRLLPPQTGAAGGGGGEEGSWRGGSVEVGGGGSRWTCVYTDMYRCNNIDPVSTVTWRVSATVKRKGLRVFHVLTQSHDTCSNPHRVPVCLLCVSRYWTSRSDTRTVPQLWDHSVGQTLSDVVSVLYRHTCTCANMWPCLNNQLIFQNKTW